MIVDLLHKHWPALCLGVAALAWLHSGCTQAVPHDLVEAVESIDERMTQLHAAELAPEEYSRFANRWMTLRTRAVTEDDVIHWPWESNELELAFLKLKEDGTRTVDRIIEKQEGQRRLAQERLAAVKERAQVIATQVGAIESRYVLGGKPVETDLLVTQAKAFYDQGRYEHSLQASERAARKLRAQAALLSRELGRYANPDRIAQWQLMAQDTIDWSKRYRATAIVVSKAERTITLYRNGRRLLSYPVRLGFNGIKEKRYQGDGATPEGRYHVAEKLGQGQTQFYRALKLDYPNREDRRRFIRDTKSGHIPAQRKIGGQIEIHGEEKGSSAQTLGCVMLENPHMATLYHLVKKGTPVTIVGALHEQNAVALALATLVPQADET